MYDRKSSLQFRRRKSATMQMTRSICNRELQVFKSGAEPYRTSVSDSGLPAKIGFPKMKHFKNQMSPDDARSRRAINFRVMLESDFSVELRRGG
jgi:hypothetical protein